MSNACSITIFGVCCALLAALAAPALYAASPAGDHRNAVHSDPVYFPLAGGPAGLPFSEAVQVGPMLYLSGSVGVDGSGKLIAGGIKAETKQVMDNIGASLTRHGSSWDRVVQCTVALADIMDWPAFNEVYKPYFKNHFPARMAYAAAGLALGAKVEVQCNAAVK